MKTFFLILMTLSSVAIAARPENFTDFTGTWHGPCFIDGETEEIELVIKNDLNSISFDGNLYSLKSPTSTKVTQKDPSGQIYQIQTVYDWRWNEDKSEIISNERWLAWYLNQSGTWAGNGMGSVKMIGDKLVTRVTFSIEVDGKIVKSTDEHCAMSRN